MIEELKGKKIRVYDLEIKLAIDGERIKWADLDKVGISVGCCYDYEDQRTKFYTDSNLHELVALLNSAHLVVAFNQLGFDNNLLRANGFELKTPAGDLEHSWNYDMLLQSRLSLGYVPGELSTMPKGCKLDNHLEAMFGKDSMKTGHGEIAPLLYQRGDWGRLMSYVAEDVRLETKLFEEIWRTGCVKTIQNGEKKVRHPMEWL